MAFRTIDGRDELLLDPDKVFHAASTMKVPVMIELFQQAEQRQLSLDERLPIRNEFKSIVDGSPYKLSEGDDSDKEIYSAVGKSLTLRQLCEAMITVSSNFAANLLIERLGVDRIRSTVSRLGADGMQVLRGVEDQKAFDKGLNNSTTARGLLILFQKLATGHAVSVKADAAMIEILKRQKFNEAIPAGVPAGTAVAHKTGNITKIHHDAAIVFAPRPVRAGDSGSRNSGSEGQRAADEQDLGGRVQAQSGVSLAGSPVSVPDRRGDPRFVDTHPAHGAARAEARRESSTP